MLRQGCDPTSATTRGATPPVLQQGCEPTSATTGVRPHQCYNRGVTPPVLHQRCDPTSATTRVRPPPVLPWGCTSRYYGGGTPAGTTTRCDNRDEAPGATTGMEPAGATTGWWWWWGFPPPVLSAAPPVPERGSVTLQVLRRG